ncbi:1-acyl-sn-glycerol-3-phosphate acyltransferase [Arabidopsis thaliana]|uniref:1-acyl-sn-glycerol-3-phosphate acyltransferase n=1 Tax=Arabidopsis thaliana TaxID=3702 RepID=F4I6Q3_ARATH|nr:1-acyl-sn-glycerol-3-phosphate acyltransferase [Arabidopsis thaliana]AEE34231.1 1-acyl-sn-glycerol-3-phosphate acyltransferase [Arabidopsis thaliana]|eukprot:NP_001031230.1 1-acyl-sn-glycerol-3-phosphate acyltransferase [Arabidopsis thaliana]
MILINSNSPTLISAVRFVGSSPFTTRGLSQSTVSISRNKSFFFHFTETKEKNARRDYLRVSIVCDAGGMFPVDPWAPTIDSQSIASQLFAVSLFPYIGFLYFLTKSKSAPKLTLFGFYFLLAFVGATIPAGIYGNFLQHYKTLIFFLLIFKFVMVLENCLNGV